MIHVITKTASGLYTKAQENVESIWGKWSWKQLGKGALIGAIGVGAVALRPWEWVQVTINLFKDIGVVYGTGKDLASSASGAVQSMHHTAKGAAFVVGAGVSGARSAANVLSSRAAYIPQTVEETAGLGLSTLFKTSTYAAMYLSTHFASVVTRTTFEAAYRGVANGVAGALEARGLVGRSIGLINGLRRPVDTRRISLFEGHSPHVALVFALLAGHNILRG